MQSKSYHVRNKLDPKNEDIRKHSGESGCEGHPGFGTSQLSASVLNNIKQ